MKIKKKDTTIYITDKHKSKVYNGYTLAEAMEDFLNH